RRVVRRLVTGAVEPGTLPDALRGMLGTGPDPRAFACVGAVCHPPATDDAAWASLLTKLGSR
ncbi:MAG TPA: hypothetical protein VJ773_05080, partial [Gemmatimonadales bacterium]|nr:hypothetical protein [Gemmatimonadales bacterium]